MLPGLTVVGSLVPTMAQPTVTEDHLVFTFDDPERRLARVSLDCDDAIDGRRRFRRTAAGWSLRLPRPFLNRVEYRLVLTSRGGDTNVRCDPDNAERVQTAFGERSVVSLPGYDPPAWVQRDPEPGSWRDLTHTDADLGDLPIVLWAPAGLDDAAPAPLLVVHDGPEYERLAGLTTYAGAQIEDGCIPSFRVALMQPVARDDWYAANPAYVAAELAAVDLVAETVATAGPLVVMGASLGGITAILVGLAEPGRVGGVFAQSGSFFTSDLDEQESSYPYFEQVSGAVLDLPAAVTSGPLVVGMTCGRMEENWQNNEAMAARLSGVGHLVELTCLDDLHNYTAWRDAFDPALTQVLRAVWGEPKMAT